jgi:hypothetical protein
MVYGFSPACFKILFKVPLGMSIPGWPATVTVPLFQRMMKLAMAAFAADLVPAVVLY